MELIPCELLKRNLPDFSRTVRSERRGFAPSAPSQSRGWVGWSQGSDWRRSGFQSQGSGGGARSSGIDCLEGVGCYQIHS